MMALEDRENLEREYFWNTEPYRMHLASLELPLDLLKKVNYLSDYVEKNRYTVGQIYDALQCLLNASKAIDYPLTYVIGCLKNNYILNVRRYKNMPPLRKSLSDAEKAEILEMEQIGFVGGYGIHLDQRKGLIHFYIGDHSSARIANSWPLTSSRCRRLTLSSLALMRRHYDRVVVENGQYLDIWGNKISLPTPSRYVALFLKLTTKEQNLIDLGALPSETKEPMPAQHFT